MEFLRPLRAALALCVLLLPTVVWGNSAALNEAISAAGARDWSKVSAARSQISNQAARDVVDWMRLRGKQGSYSECRDFVARNDDWPGMPLLRQNCEPTIPRGANSGQVLAFFDGYIPRTGTGSLRLAEAYLRTDRAVEAAREIKRGWLTFNMNEAEHNAFTQRNGLTIKDLHEERLDMLLWRGNAVAAKRMYPLVDKGWHRLAEARLALRNNEKGVDDLIAAVPAALKNDPGLAYERFAWRSRKGRTVGALEILQAQSKSAETLGQPQEWSNRRRSLAREMMRDRRPKLAYELAANHHLTSGSNYADLEWLSGFIALRKLNQPDTAIEHFNKFLAAVETPISLGRAGYWLGRAYEAAGQTDKAAEAYGYGARFQSSFYGQLAAQKAGLSPDSSMTGTEQFGDWKQAAFTKSSVFSAAMQLYAAGQSNLAERFLVHLGETQTRQGLGQLATMALDMDEPHIALMISKQAARQGYEIYKSYFPLATPAGMNIPVAQEFALAIARRESEFDPIVVSGAGARGLMQLMPATAKETAKSVGLTYSRGRLLTDPVYNATLGTAFLAELSRRYAGNPVLMSVAYNAGPSRADRWMREYGDPRASNVDVIDWIEHIPFRETRNYVMRVTESFGPYRARLSGVVPTQNLLAELKR